MNTLATTVSVVIPTRNRATVLVRAIQSVLSQTRPPIELIVVDDCSSDNTVSIVRGLRDPRVKLLSLQLPVGANSARNSGAAMAKGEFVAFQDSDDVWLPHKLEMQMREIENDPTTDAVFSRYVRIRRNTAEVEPVDLLSLSSERMHAELLRRNIIGTPTLVVRRDVMSALGGFDETLRRYQDWEFGLRLTRQHKTIMVSEVLVAAHEMSGSISQDFGAAIESINVIRRRHSSEYAANRPALGCLIAKTGDIYRRSGRPLLSALAYLRSWCLDIRRIDRLLSIVSMLVALIAARPVRSRGH